MCHFISGIIPVDFDLNDLNEISSFYSITFSKCDNDFVIEQLDSKDSYLIKDSKLCDCVTELGVLQRIENSDEKRIEKRELDKLKLKGWSDSKVQRWIYDKNKTIEREKNKYNNYKTSEHSDVQRWIKFINELFSRSKIKRFGLLLHWYNGSVFSERIKIQEKFKLRLADFTDQSLLYLKEDCVYYIEK